MTPVSRQTIRAIQSEARALTERYDAMLARPQAFASPKVVHDLAIDVRDLSQLVAGLAGLVERLSEDP